MVALAPSIPSQGTDLPAWRLNALRCAYLLLIVGLGIQVWPGIVLRHAGWELMEGVVQCMLGALSLLAILGLRHPLRMLPLLMFEMAWKAIWLAVVAAPKWASGGMDEDTAATAFACLLVVVFPIVIPWRHLAATFFAGPGDRWR